MIIGYLKYVIYTQAKLVFLILPLSLGEGRAEGIKN